MSRIFDESFDDILRAHAGLIGRIAASYEADPSRRDDLCQDIAYAIWQALSDFRGEAALRTFVARVAHNRCASHALAEQRRPRTDGLAEDLIDAAFDPSHHADLEQRRERLFAAVRHLPLGMRQAVSLALEGFSHGEIASALGIAVNSVDAQISRARRRLVELLGDS
jgi:RNA polymerase sigma factor (sigma-70 family)